MCVSNSKILYIFINTNERMRKLMNTGLRALKFEPVLYCDPRVGVSIYLSIIEIVYSNIIIANISDNNYIIPMIHCHIDLEYYRQKIFDNLR